MNYNYEAALTDALNRVNYVINRVAIQIEFQVCPTYPVTVREMFDLALRNDLRLGHYAVVK